MSFISTNARYYVLDNTGATFDLSEYIVEMREDINTLMNQSYPGLDVDLQDLIAQNSEAQEKITKLENEIEALKTEIQRLKFETAI